MNNSNANNNVEWNQSADTLRNLPIIGIDEFNNRVAQHISSRIDVSKIKTVEDIYNQYKQGAFSGTMRFVFPNLHSLSNCIESTHFGSWWVIEDENRHHCIIV